MTKRLKLSSAIAAGAILALVYLTLFAPTEFERDFDRNLAGAPYAASLARRDPELRRLLLRESERAFDAGGWRAANRTMHSLVAKEFFPYADDDHVLAGERARLRVLSRLAATPTACKAFLLVGSEEGDFPHAQAEIANWVDAQNAAVVNGFERKRSGTPWVQADAWHMVGLLRSLELGPETLAPAELKAVRSDNEVDRDPAVYCSAEIKRAKNLLAKNAEKAAEIMRQRMSWSDAKELLAEEAALCRRADASESGIDCAAVGAAVASQ